MDLGSIFITRDQPNDVTIRVRSPGETTESKVTLTFETWSRIAIPPDLAVSMAGDFSPRAGAEPMTRSEPGHALKTAEPRPNSGFDSRDGGQLLRDLEEFLDQQADADNGRPNEAMRLLIEVRNLLLETE